MSGIVTRVKRDHVMAQVEMICGPYRVVSLMSSDAADELGLEPGVRAIASVKSTNVVVEVPSEAGARRAAPPAPADRAAARRRGQQTLTVLAAASLTGTFTELAEVFEDEHPGVEVELVFGSSTTLAEQAVDGAPGDVLATADETSMSVAEDGNALADSPRGFVSNRLTLVTPPDNPAGIEALADLDDPAVDYVMCADDRAVRCRRGALLEDAGIDRSTGQRGGRRQGRAGARRPGRGRRGARLPHRRRRGRRRRHRDASDGRGRPRTPPTTSSRRWATAMPSAPTWPPSSSRWSAATRPAQVFTEAGFGGIVRE